MGVRETTSCNHKLCEHTDACVVRVMVCVYQLFSYTGKDREHVVRFIVTMGIKSAGPAGGGERVKRLTERRLASECVCVRPSDKYG